MNIDRGKVSEIVSWVLVACALLTTILVVRGEFVQESTTTAATATEWQATYVDEWEDALTVGIRAGSADAPIQVVEFTDFQCPYCARFEATVRTIRAKYPDRVAFTFAPYPLYYHEFAETAERVAECAHLQGRFEAMRSLLFEKQQEFGSVPWTDFANQAGIENISLFDVCVNDTEPMDRIERSK